jgi:hypothetical protein
VAIKVNGEEIETKAFHSITVSNAENDIEHRYTAIRIISADPERREQVIEKALKELEGWQKRYDQYADIFGQNLFKEIQKSVERVRHKIRRRQPEAAPNA